MTRDLGPVPAVKSDSVQKALMLVIGPVSVPLTALVLYDRAVWLRERTGYLLVNLFVTLFLSTTHIILRRFSFRAKLKILRRLVFEIKLAELDGL